MNRNKLSWVAGSCLLAVGCVSFAASDGSDISATLKASFSERGIAKLDRLDQSPLQKVCSQYAVTEMPKALRDGLEKDELARIKFPSDGKWLGDWKRGEQVAQSGRGMQFSDTAQTVNGANCYACHELSKKEVSFGNIGPSLHNYGKLRGNSEPILKYTWGKLWNSHAYKACTSMPRFGDAGILTEAQLKDVMALLLDPESPVNQ
jgi:L-cysteine S-thiosulfotransferase